MGRDARDRRARIDAWHVSLADHFSEEQAAIIRSGLNLLAHVESGVQMATNCPRTINHMCTKYDAESGLVVGGAEAVFCGVSPEECAAYMMNFDSAFTASTCDPRNTVSLDALKEIAPHHRISYMEMKTSPFKNRAWVNDCVCQKLAHDPLTYVWVAAPSQHQISRASNERVVRAEGLRCMYITAVSERKTHVKYACRLDLKGLFPSWLTHSLIIPTLLRLPYTIQVYFQSVRPLSDCGVEDGEVVAHHLMDLVESMTSRTGQTSSIRLYVLQTAMLRDAGLAHLNTILVKALTASEPQAHIARSSLEPESPVRAEDPACLTENEAREIGLHFALLFESALGPAEAAAQLVRRYFVLQKLDSRCAWFRPLLTTLADRRLTTMRGAVRSLFGSRRLAVGLQSRLGSLSEVSLKASLKGAKVAPRPSQDAYAQNGRPELDHRRSSFSDDVVVTTPRDDDFDSVLPSGSTPAGPA